MEVSLPAQSAKSRDASVLRGREGLAGIMSENVSRKEKKEKRERERERGFDACRNRAAVPRASQSRAR